MNRLVILASLLLLAGCYSDQKQQLARCQIEDGKAAKQDDPATSILQSTSRIELCMQAGGYELTAEGQACAPSFKGPDVVQVTRDYFVATTAMCYRPMALGSKLAFSIENMIGQVK